MVIDMMELVNGVGTNKYSDPSILGENALCVKRNCVRMSPHRKEEIKG